jgi:LysM repeat protein
MEKFNLNKIIQDNLDKAKFQSKAQPRLPEDGWLNGYRSGGTYISDRAKATQFGQYKMGGGMFPPYHSFTPLRMDYGGDPSIPDLDGYQLAGQVKKLNSAPNTNSGGYDYEKKLMLNVNPYLQSQMELAKNRNINTGIHNGPLDAIRHAGSAAGTTTEVFPNWLPAPLKIIGTNVLGAAHEFTTPRKINWQETGSDLYNNFVGSIIGALPISNYSKQQMVIDAQNNGILSNIHSNRKVNTAKQKKQKGGMITDPMGQWAHPGENTRIPGGDITMQGVPYPVLAKASNGMTTLMQPGQEYSFPGADYVDEYPMMQDGGLLNNHQNDIEESKNAMLDFYNSRPANINNPNVPEYIDDITFKERSPEFMKAFQRGAMGYFNPLTNVIGYDAKSQMKKGYGNVKSTIKHEIGHDIYKYLNDDMHDIVKESILPSSQVRENMWYDDNRKGKKFARYITKPTEFYTRRYNVFDTFGLDPSQPLTNEQAQGFVDLTNNINSTYTQGRNKEEAYKEFSEKYPKSLPLLEKIIADPNSEETIQFMNSIKNTPETYMRMFNDVTAISGQQYPVARYGGFLPQAQYGCHGKSCTQTGEGIKKVGSRLGLDDTGSSGGNGGFIDYKALNSPIGWNDLLTYNSAGLEGKELKNYNKNITARTKSLQTQFPGLTEDQLRVAGADSARIRQRMGDLKRYDQPSEQTYDKAYHNFYRPLMNQSTPVTVPQILQYQSQQPGGLNAFQQMVTGNYGRPKAKYGGWLDKYQEGGGTQYTVKKGDTLGKIGKQFGMTPQEIAQINGISNIDFIRTNQVLNIPGATQQQPVVTPVDSQFVGPRVIEQPPVQQQAPMQQQAPVVMQKAPIVSQTVSTPAPVSYPNLDPDTAGIVSKYTAPANSDTPEDAAKREKARKIVEIARKHIAENKYFDVPADVAEASRKQGQEPAGCVGGACHIAQEAGAMPKIFWSNTAFTKAAPELGFPNKGYGLRGIQNLEAGDFVTYQTELAGYDEKGNPKYIPRHTQIFLGINPQTKQYEFFDNYHKRMMTYGEDEMKDKLKQTKNPYDYGAVIYKNNPFHPTENSFTNQTTQEAINTEVGKAEQLKTPTNYKYSIRSDAKDYHNGTKIIMDKFVNYANDDKNLNNLVDKMGATKEEIHDSLLNVFGELGQENNWSSWGNSPRSKIENLAEKAMVFFGGGKKYSVGPGQNKFNSIPADIREKFDIKSTKDLYDMNKVIPLMVAQDLLNKKTLRIWGEQNTLSDRLIGHTDNDNPLRADDLKGGVGRWSPYLRNEFSLINSRKRIINNNDLNPWNTEVVSNYDPTTGVFMNPRKLDEGSYPDKVFHKTDDNLQRVMINPGTEYNPQTLSNFVLLAKTKKKAKKEFGGQHNWLNNYK